MPDLGRLVNFAVQKPLSPPEIASLAVHLAASGRRLDVASGPTIADLASTGGPGSLSTFIGPLALRALGYRVIKVGVPGRPSGAIDSFSLIPGFQVVLEEPELRRVLLECGYAHSLGGADFAPLDAALFAYRRKVGAVAVPGLTAASLLSKKLAVGVTFLVLDVRVWSDGNLGSTLDEARQHARALCRAAALLGIEVVAVVNQGSLSRHGFLGRGESLHALSEILYGALDSASRLALHAGRCLEMVSEATGRKPSHSGIVRAFHDHLTAQGASQEAFVAIVNERKTMPSRWHFAEQSGSLSIDIRGLRNAIVELQNDEGRPPFSDPCGVDLLRETGNIASGAPVLRARGTDAEILDRLNAGQFITIHDTHQTAEQDGFEVIRA